MFCVNCGKELSDNADFCVSCGHPVNKSKSVPTKNVAAPVERTVYCRNCGAQMNENAAVCLNCGVKKGRGNAYCANCGNAVAENAVVCLSCGASTKGGDASWGDKDKIIAGLLALFLGGIGIHHFYLRENKKGIVKLLFSWTYIPSLLALFDAIRIFLGSYEINPDKFI